MSVSGSPQAGVAAQPPVAGTTVGAVSLTVPSLPRSRAFYERVLGLTEVAPVDQRTSALGSEGLALGAVGGRPLVVLHEDRAAPTRDPRAPGLFHLALLLPSRPELARALRRVAGAGWPLSGASDHLVSEALYLSDPDGNGIELYRDRPREVWSRDPDGAVRMATLPLDLQALAAESDDAPAPDDAALPTRSRMGHVHLQVSDIARAEAFYHGLLGFDMIVRSYPGALFVSAGGYHHHIGLNTWNSAGAPPPPLGAVGLRSYEIVLPDVVERDRILARLTSAGAPAETAPGEAVAIVRDPFGTAVCLRAA